MYQVCLTKRCLSLPDLPNRSVISFLPLPTRSLRRLLPPYLCPTPTSHSLSLLLSLTLCPPLSLSLPRFRRTTSRETFPHVSLHIHIQLCHQCVAVGINYIEGTPFIRLSPVQTLLLACFERVRCCTDVNTLCYPFTVYLYFGGISILVEIWSISLSTKLLAVLLKLLQMYNFNIVDI